MLTGICPNTTNTGNVHAKPLTPFSQTKDNFNIYSDQKSINTSIPFMPRNVGFGYIFLNADDVYM